MKIPLSPEDVTPSWLCGVLQSDLSTSSVSVSSLEPLKNKNGVLSDVFKAEAIIDGERKRLFIKILPSAGQTRDFVRETRMDITEIEAYRTVAKELIDFEKETLNTNELSSALPAHIASAYSPRDTPTDEIGFFLVLEDVSDRYTVRHFGKGLSAKEVTTGVTKLALFHALAFCYGRKKGVDFKERYGGFLNAFVDSFEVNSALHDYFDGTQVPIYLKTLEGVEDGPELEKVAQKLRKVLCQRYIKVIKAS